MLDAQEARTSKAACRRVVEGYPVHKGICKIGSGRDRERDSASRRRWIEIELLDRSVRLVLMLPLHSLLPKTQLLIGSPQDRRDVFSFPSLKQRLFGGTSALHNASVLLSEP